MTARLVALAEALKTDLSDQLGKTVVRRYTPYVGRAQFSSERITVFPADDTSELQVRQFDRETLVVGVEVAKALGESGDQTASDPDADINQLPALDELMQTVDNIKDLFRDEGALRENLIGSCYWAGTENRPPYDAELLMNHRIFSSVVLLTFTYNGG